MLQSDDQLPEDVKETLWYYLIGIRSTINTELRAVYLHGSIALGEYNPLTSDIDFLTIFARRISLAEVEELRYLHNSIRKIAPKAKRMEGIYIAEPDILKDNFLGTGHYVRNGRLLARQQNVGALARQLLYNKGIVLTGPPANQFFSPIPPQAVKAEMNFNLNQFWLEKANKPYLLLFDDMVDYSVLTIGRILYTLETGGIISKRRAADYLENNFQEWSELIKDVRSRFHPFNSSPSLLTRLGRATQTRRFILTMIDYANKQYQLGIK